MTVRQRAGRASKYDPYNTYDPEVDWWSPGEITFTPIQIIFLLDHFEKLAMGTYPTDPKQEKSGYTDIRGVFGRRNRRRKWAAFETPCDLHAELSERMKIVGQDSSILRDRFILGMTEEEAAAMRGIDQSTLSRRCRAAMRLMSGWKRKQKRVGNNAV